MKILITGANGQLGLELQKQLKQANNITPDKYIIIPTDYMEMDITDRESVNNIFAESTPDVVINCAAHTAVDKCEEEIDRAHAINQLGPRNLALACEKVGAKLVQVSTDYVFSGEFNGKRVDNDNKLEARKEMSSLSTPWVEGDEVNPQSTYGTSKEKGEEEVRTICKKHFIVRTAWLYGEGNNFVRTMVKLGQTHPKLTVVADQFGNPTSTKDLAKAIINLIDTEYYGTYHGTCEGVCSWYDFAKKIFEIKGIEVDVQPVTSEEFPRPAKRPFYSALENSNLKKHGLNTFRHWEEALADYLEEEEKRQANGQN